MAAKNDITGDSLVSRSSEEYRNNYDAIFGKKGKTNEQRTGCNDGSVAGSSGTGGTEHSGESEGTDTEPDAYPHDRVPADSNH